MFVALAINCDYQEANAQPLVPDRVRPSGPKSLSDERQKRRSGYELRRPEFLHQPDNRTARPTPASLCADKAIAFTMGR